MSRDSTWLQIRVPVFVLCIILIVAYLCIEFRDEDETFAAHPKNFSWKDCDVEGNVDFHRHIASELLELTRKIRNDMNINKRILEEMQQIASKLDSRFALSTHRLPKNALRVPDTCGEVYKGTTFGQPWYRTGFVPSPTCKRKKALSELITILLLSCNVSMDQVIQHIRTYDSDIEVVLESVCYRTHLKSDHPKSNSLNTNHKNLPNSGRKLNLLVKNVTTPYVLIARDLFYFNDLARLERQIYVISRTSVIGVAGGAFRNESGHWKVGCYLSKIRNYFLKFTEGYEYSALDCMLCDYLEGPFVALTSVMKQIPFKEDLLENVLFEDWFLRVKQNNILTVNCPDVLYFKRGPVEGVLKGVESPEYSAWSQLASEWQVDHVHYPSRISVKFSCDELGIICNPTKWMIKSFLIPTCCMREITRALSIMDNFTEIKGISYEIESGTLLGALKLGSFLPWDNNVDMTFHEFHYPAFYHYQQYFLQQGLIMNFNNNNIVLNTPHIKLKLWSSNNLSMFLQKMMQNQTRLKVNGIWVSGKWNPGLYARNRYGPGFLKHAQHWSLFKGINAWYNYRPGTWLPCSDTSHHACLNNYPTDGSINLLPESC